MQDFLKETILTIIFCVSLKVQLFSRKKTLGCFCEQYYVIKNFRASSHKLSKNFAVMKHDKKVILRKNFIEARDKLP